MFLLYKNQEEELKLGILNLDLKSENADLPIPAHHHDTAQAFEKEFVLTISEINEILNTALVLSFVKRSKKVIDKSN